MNLASQAKSGCRIDGAKYAPASFFTRRLVIAAILCGTSLSYLFLSAARRPRPLPAGQTTELYALLAWSFLQGNTTLPIEPRPELLSLPDPYDWNANANYRLLDASLYKGRYYLYFGAVPAVMLFVPYRLVTGLDLPNRVAVPIFCIAGFLSSCALFFLIARHNRWELPLWLECAVIVLLGSMSLVSLILRRPLFYEVAIAGGYCFVMGGFLILGVAVLDARTTWKLLLLAGLMFGLAVGCRPHFVLICAIVLGAFAIRERRRPGLVMAIVAGMFVCCVVLGWYNYARFHNPLEFGRMYQLTSAHFPVEINPGTTFCSAEEFLFVPPQVDTALPFFHTKLINPLPGRAGQPISTEGMIGLVPAAPLALLGCFAPWFFRKGKIADGLLDETSSWLLYTMYWSGVGIFVVLCVIGWVLGRYLVDFAPLLTFDGISVIAMLSQNLSRRPIRRAFSWGVGVTAIYGATLNLALATPPLNQILEFLRE